MVKQANPVSSTHFGGFNSQWSFDAVYLFHLAVTGVLRLLLSCCFSGLTWLALLFLHLKVQVIWVSPLLPMHQIYVCNMLILLYILHIMVKGPTLCFGNADENKILRVGEELWRESLPLKGGSRLYQLQDLKPQTWYEVKISYPASIPASFSIQLEKDISDMVLNNNRRLLNTEKLIFKTEIDLDKTHVLVTVEPEGFVAIPYVPDRRFIIFNIVCDELLLGIPHQVWWVVVLAILCLGIAFIIPFFLPSYLLPKSQNLGSADHVAKTS